ncbi:MAG: hypothetical protein FE78DRAFT_381255 [Acidomyces sp. 'richmondensis']|nr:MAG: hypothetical protein FE78DRAFT_381255 [Acidomyces sp. 'richmondensis']
MRFYIIIPLRISPNMAARVFRSRWPAGRLHQTQNPLCLEGSVWEPSATFAARASCFFPIFAFGDQTDTTISYAWTAAPLQCTLAWPLPGMKLFVVKMDECEAIYLL